MVGHKGPEPVQKYMSEGQMNTIALCVSMYFKVGKVPTKNGWWARFGPWAICWEPLTYSMSIKANWNWFCEACTKETQWKLTVNHVVVIISIFESLMQNHLNQITIIVSFSLFLGIFSIYIYRPPYDIMIYFFHQTFFCFFQIVFPPK